MPVRRKRAGPESGGLLSSDPSRSALEECDALLAALGSAGDAQRRRAHFVNLSIAAGTAAIPVLLLLSTQYLNFWLGKVLPAILASLTTTAAVLLQLLKPHERWRLLRVNQAVLETARFRYAHELPPYKGADRDDRLLESVVAVAQATNNEWAALQPESAGAAELLQAGH
jgi:4-amino-4-deoxy-L-arabinose transferase-like glycosyltransferase